MNARREGLVAGAWFGAALTVVVGTSASLFFGTRAIVRAVRRRRSR